MALLSSAILTSTFSGTAIELKNDWKSEADVIVGDWMRSPWFGLFYDQGDWIYNETHGWWYTLDGDSGGFHFFDSALGSWGWISELTHPWVYEHDAGGGWKVRHMSLPDAITLIHSRLEADLLVDLVDESSVSRRMADMHPGGYWPSINYEDTSRDGWQHPTHLSNLLLMARGYRHSASWLRGNRSLRTAIMAGLDFWLENDFVPDDHRWHRTVGTPLAMARIMLLMYPWLSDEQLEAGLAIVSRADFEPGESAMIYLGINAKLAVLSRDASLLRAVVRAIENELEVAGPGELRLQADMSFHHRPDRVNYTTTYGLRYPEFFVPWALRCAGTPFHFGTESSIRLVDYYLDGISGHAAFGVYPCPGSLNRSITRRGRVGAMGPRYPEGLLQVTNYRRAEMEALAVLRGGGIAPTPLRNRHFWRSDNMSHQREDYFVTAYAYSSRNHNTDRSVGREGVKMHHLRDGSSFLQRHGGEYYDIFPVWDWQMIPGVTVVREPGLNGPEVDPSYGAGKVHLGEANPQVPGVSAFVGGVSDGHYGAAVFDFESVHQDLSARKSWFFFDEEYICLGAGIRSASAYPVVTALNQCNLIGPVTVSADEGMRELEAGHYEVSGTPWVHHDEVGYVFLESGDVHLSNTIQEGGWHWITKSTGVSQEPVEREVFRLWIDHGEQPEEASYAYAVLPGAGTVRAAEYHASPVVEILANTPALQAVFHEDLQLLMAVFYEAGSVELNETLRIEARQPMLVQARLDGGGVSQLHVSDPSQNLMDGEIRISDASGSQTMEIAFPQGVYAGQSVELSLNES